jgi:tetratricopeptide (TPR) repeat protein
MKKAFLSHSSADKPLVRQVAEELGRDRAVYDEKSFDVGYDLKDAIRDGLDRSSVFVLFASESSVGPKKSDWLRLEDEDASARTLSGIIRRPLVFIIDDKVSVRDLPPWLQAAKVSIHPQHLPKLIARKIQQHLDDLTREDQAVPVVGRGLDVDRAIKLIRPRDGPVARTVAFYGLTGIGRRTLSRQVFRDLFMMKELYEVRAEEGDDLGDVTLKLADAIGYASPGAELEALARQVRKESTDQLLNRCVEYLKVLVDSKFVPTLVDFGGVIDADGHLTHAVEQLRRVVTKENDVNLALIVSRRLADEAALRMQAVPNIRVDPLALDDMERLMSIIGENDGLTFDSQSLRSLAMWVRGHPPSAAYAVELVARDGIAQVIDGSKIVAYRDSYFIKALERDGQLTKHRRTILRTLAEYGHLPEAALIMVVGLAKSDYDREVRYILDKALIIPERQGLYRLADPLVDAVTRIISNVKIDHHAVATGLEEFIRKTDDIISLDHGDQELRRGRFELDRLLWRARTAAGDEASANKNLHLAADVISALRTVFHSRDFEGAVRLGQSAVEMRPESAQARSLLARAYVNLHQYREAQEEINAIRDRGYLREHFFLLGYLYHHQRDHQNAIYAFKQAIQYGRTDSGTLQRLAESYYFTEEYADAEHFVRKALEGRPEDRYALDLHVRILIRRAEFAKARTALGRLMVYDDSGYYLHRKSVLELAEGNIPQALTDAAEANRQQRNVVAIQVQLALCQIAAKNFTAARAVISELKRRPKGSARADEIVGLEIKLANARGKYEEGLLLWDSLEVKKGKIPLAMRLESLKGYIASLKPSDPLRQAMIEQRDEAIAALGSESMESVWASGVVF